MRLNPRESALDRDADGRVVAVRDELNQEPVYVLRHFLADGTSELVLDKEQRALGEGFCTTLIKRQRWPKVTITPITIHVDA